jgi:FkbM family methyltransferase
MLDKMKFFEVSADETMKLIDNKNYGSCCWYENFFNGMTLVFTHVNASILLTLLSIDWLPEERYYFEAGANNGVSQSNTFQLDHYFGWQGILVEPVKENFRKCQKYRNAKCINAALVSNNFENSFIEGQFSDSVISDREELDNGLGAGCTQSHKDSYPNLLKTVPAMTITEALIKGNAPKNLGFLSLDVEGYELEALYGLDFNRFRPKVICIELTRDDKEIKSILENNNYRLLAMIDAQNLLYVTNEQ